MLNRIVVGTVAFFVCLGCASVVWPDDGVTYQFMVVDETFSATRKDRSYRDRGSNLYPWVEHTRISENGDEELIVISNNCGFAEYEYRSVSLERFREFLDSDAKEFPQETIVAVGKIGEWCRLATHIYESEMLLTTRSWQNTLYIVDSTDMFFHRSDDAYVVDVYFIHEWKLDDYVKPIPDADKQDSCWKIEGMTPRVQKSFEDEGYVRFDDDLCAVNGVYVRDIPATQERRR